MDDRVEAVARAFCRNMKMDPDEVRGARGKSPRWRLYEGKAVEAIAMHDAIAEAAERLERRDG